MTTYHFEEKSVKSSNIRKTYFPSKQENNDSKNDAIKMRFFYLKINRFFFQKGK